MDIFVGPLLYVALLVLGLVKWAVILSVILSWLINFNIVNTHNPVVNTIGEILFRITEPCLRPIRRLLPPSSGIDFAPLVFILILIFLELVLSQVGMKLLGPAFR